MTRDDWLDRGEQAFEDGDVDGALSAFEAARGIGPPNARLWSDLGVVAYRRGDTELAKACFERARVLDPANEAVRDNLAAIAEVATLDVSVIVPTYGRPDCIRNLVSDLKAQTLDPRRFELIIIDDGSGTDLSFIDTELKPSFDVTLMSQENKGPGAARNRGLTRASADLVLFLNDDGRPDERLLEEHLAAHRAAENDVAVLGTFPYTESARRSPFVRLIEKAGFTFAYNQMTPGKPHEWCFFWTCNISLKKAHVVAVGAFDEAFCDPMSEDIELGWRLQRDCDLRVLYHPAAVCQHDHTLTVAQFIKRQISMGVNAYRMFAKYENPVPLMLGWLGPYDDKAFAGLNEELRGEAKEMESYRQRLEAWEAGAALVAGSEESRTFELAFAMCQRLTAHHSARGIVDAWRTGKPFRATEKSFPTNSPNTPRHVPVLS